MSPAKHLITMRESAVSGHNIMMFLGVVEKTPKLVMPSGWRVVEQTLEQLDRLLLGRKIFCMFKGVVDKYLFYGCEAEVLIGQNQLRGDGQCLVIVRKRMSRTAVNIPRKLIE